LQRDYVLRMIEQMAAAIAQLRKRILGGEDVTAELQEMAAQYGVDLTTARAVDGETLLLLVSPGGQSEPARCWITAELLYLDALRLEAGGDTVEAAHGFAKALLLYETIDATMLGGLPAAGDRIGELRVRLHDSPLQQQ
jgi:hypothetical protein